MTIKATTKALLGTAVSFALLGTAGMANAADLDNVSDDDLLARIERLEKIIGPGENNAVRNGNDKVRLTLSGQINRLAIGFGDGEDFEVRNADNTTSSTRFRLLGSAKLDENWSAGTSFEIEINSGTGEGSASVNQNAENPIGDLGTDVRRAALFVQHKTFGRLLIGQFQTATDFSFHNDLSGTFIAGYSEVHLIGGGLNFRNDATGNLSTITISDVTSGNGEFDGGGRDDVIRYDTAKLYGFQGAVSFTNGDEYAFNLGYNNKDLYGFSVAADIGYTSFGAAGTGRDLISGSISTVHNATGLNLTYSYSDDDGENTLHYGKLGWKTKLTSLGSSNFVIEAGRFDRESGVNANTLAFTAEADGAGGTIALGTQTEATVLGGSFVQQVDALALEAFIAYRNFDLDSINGVDFEDINTITVGGRIKF